jgi:hypothetical protein
MRSPPATVLEPCPRAKFFFGCKAGLCYDLPQHMAETRA